MIRKLLNTSVFRLSLVYALLFSMVAAGALAFIYQMAEKQMQEQTDARLELEADALLDLYRRGAMEGLTAVIRLRNSKNESRYLVSRLVHRAERDYTHDLQLGYYFNDRYPHAFTTINAKDRRGRPARMMLTLLPGGYQLLVLVDLQEQQALMSHLLQTVLAASVIIFALAVAGGIFMGYNVQRRIKAVGQTANDIISGDLSQRMPVTGRNDEFDRLSLVVNTMLERIETLMQSMREVSDNLAHDLRTPLNRLRNRLETSQYQQEPQDYPQLIQDTINDLDDLIRTFNALLSIAQVESGVQREDWADVNLSTLTEELAELYTVVAEEAELSLSHQTDPDLLIHGNRQLLAQAITNLLDNAVKYTPSEGNINLQASKDKGQIVITIADNGPGIPAEKHVQVFKRFTRLDNARSTPGNGLGLSLVKAVAELHGAEIQLADNHPGLRASLIFAASD